MGGGPAGAEQLALLLVGGADDAVGKGELELGIVEHGAGDALAVLRLLHDGGADDLDGGVSAAVASGHVGIEVIDSAVQARVAKLLVHVVGTGARVVLDPDAKVLHVAVVLLGKLWVHEGGRW